MAPWPKGYLRQDRGTHELTTCVCPRPVSDGGTRMWTEAGPPSYRNELISIVSSRPGPTPIAEIGAPDISSSALT